MNIIRRHIQKQLLLWSLIALLALSGIMTLLDFIHELSKIDEYTQLMTAIYMTWLSLPMTMYELLPIAVLIGGLAGLGNLSAQNELLAAQTLGYSPKDIVLFVMNPVMLIIFAAVMMSLSEIAVPAAESRTIQFEEQEEFEYIKNNLWVRDKNNFIHIGRSIGDSLYRDITIYEYNREHGRLNEITQAETMIVEDGQFLLETLSIAQFNENRMNLLPLARKILPRTTLQEKNLTRPVLPESLNFVQLYAEIKSLEQSHLNADSHRLVLWKKFSAVLSIIAMLLVAMPLVFGNSRGNTLGKRLFWGIILGLIYTITDRFTGNLFIVGQGPAWLGAFLIPVLVTAFAYWRLRS